jgi:hypothetical protein
MIFGNGRNIEQLVRSQNITCKNCNNTVPFILYQYKDNFKLFFISIFSYRTTYFLGCSICNAGWELDENDKEEFISINNERKSGDFSSNMIT